MQRCDIISLSFLVNIIKYAKLMERSICHSCSVISGCGTHAGRQADVSVVPSITAVSGLECDKVFSAVHLYMCV